MGGKIFLITGTTSGLGEAMADIILNKSNYKLLSLSRRSLARHESAAAYQYLFFDLAMGSLDGVFPALQEAVQGKEVILIHNASTIEPIGNIGTLAQGEINRHIATNLTSPILLCNELLQQCPEQQFTMLNISSGAAKRPIEGWAMYCATKAAMAMFFDNIHEEHPNWKVVNVNPGVIDTKMQSTIRNSQFASVERFRTLKESGQLKSPEDVAHNILAPYL